jgi:S1-C subfamily serine protease
MRFILGCIFSAVLASLCTVWLISGRDASLTANDRRMRGESPVEWIRPSIQQFYDSEGFTPEEAVAVTVYEAVNRGVVNITAKAVSERLLKNKSTEDTGSGAIIDRDGHILTNHHVVRDAKEVSVALFNGKSYDAVLIGADPLNDLAVIKIEAPEDELFPIALGSSRSLRVGMRVFALGNPFGLERTLTTGIISSLNRSLQIHGHWKIKSIIQVDAAINPGSSGGPLLDSHGWLIGINTAIATTSGQSAGVGFAIPVSLISRVVPQLLKFHKVIRPESGIDKVYQNDKGLLIAEMRPNGPAEKAGLRGPKISKSRLPFGANRADRNAADLIVAIDDQKVVTAEDFLSYIEEKKPGDEVILTIVREGRRIPVPLQLTTSDPIDRVDP